MRCTCTGSGLTAKSIPSLLPSVRTSRIPVESMNVTFRKSSTIDWKPRILKLLETLADPLDGREVDLSASGDDHPVRIGDHLDFEILGVS
jgi:hypothetical protein